MILITFVALERAVARKHFAWTFCAKNNVYIAFFMATYRTNANFFHKNRSL